MSCSSPLRTTLALVCVLHTSTPALAQDPASDGAAQPDPASADDAAASTDGDAGKRARARDAYSAGKAAYAAGDFAAAASHFARADALIPAVQAKYRYAMSLDRSGDVPGAYEAFGAVLEHADKDALGAEALAEARARRDALAVVPAKLSIVTTPAGAHVKISGVELQRVTPVAPRLAAGRHLVEVTLEGYEPYQEQLSIEPGATVEESIVLTPAASPTPALSAPPTAANPPPLDPLAPASGRSKIPGVVTLGIAGASAVVGTIFGLRALSDKDDFDQAPSTSSADDVERNALIADMAFGVTLTLGITGLVLLFADDPAPQQASVKTEPSSVSLVPYVTPHGAGAAASMHVCAHSPSLPGQTCDARHLPREARANRAGDRARIERKPFGMLRVSRHQLALAAPFLVTRALAVAFVIPIGLGGWVRGHYEGPRYLALAEHFRQALWQAGPYPRWLPNLYGGYGYPTFVFYQPLLFWVYSLWSLAAAGTGAMLAALGSLAWLGNAGAYALARRYGGRGFACLATAVFALSPYLYVNAFVRHDLSELCSMFFVPWVLLGIVLVTRCAAAGRWSFPAIALIGAAHAAVIYSHPITGVLLCLFVVPLAVAAPFSASRGAAPGLARRAALAAFSGVGLGLSAGLLLSSPYWLPLRLMQDQVWLDRAATAGFRTTLHVVELPQLFERSWGFGGSRPGAADDMSFQLGAAHFALAGLGLAIGRRERLAWGGAIAYLALIASMTPALESIWTLPVLSRMQFPWRALAVATSLQCFLFSHAGLAWARLPSRASRALAGASVLAAVVAWQWPQFQVDARMRDADASTAAELNGALQHVYKYNSLDEFLPRTSRRPPERPVGDAPIVSVTRGRVDFAPTSTRHRVRATVTIDSDAWLTVHQLFLPGWRVEVDGEPVPEAVLLRHLSPRGLMRVPLEGSESGGPRRIEVAARYSGPRGSALAAWLAGSTLLLLGAACLAGRRRPTTPRRAAP